MSVNLLLLAACIAIAATSARVPWASVGQVPIAVLAASLFHDWVTLTASMLSFLVPSIARAVSVARRFGVTEGLSSLGRVAALFFAISVAVGIVVTRFSASHISFAPLLYVSTLLLSLAIARGFAEGFPDLPKALEISGFIVALVASSIALGRGFWTPLALVLASICARAAIPKKFGRIWGSAVAATLLALALALMIGGAQH
ncbi:MAG: hypothetical protein GXO32_01480 [Crenarchaeota archaeon]|nr:hypothetical protein [Thermoproteota archaeon]